MGWKARIVEEVDPANEVFLVGVYDDSWPEPDYRRHVSDGVSHCQACYGQPGESGETNCAHPGEYVREEDVDDPTVEPAPYGLPEATRFVRVSLKPQVLAYEDGVPVEFEFDSPEDGLRLRLAGIVRELEVAAGTADPHPWMGQEVAL